MRRLESLLRSQEGWEGGDGDPAFRSHSLNPPWTQSSVSCSSFTDSDAAHCRLRFERNRECERFLAVRATRMHLLRLLGSRPRAARAARTPRPRGRFEHLVKRYL